MNRKHELRKKLRLIHDEQIKRERELGEKLCGVENLNRFIENQRVDVLISINGGILVSDTELRSLLLATFEAKIAGWEETIREMFLSMNTRSRREDPNKELRMRKRIENYKNSKSTILTEAFEIINNYHYYVLTLSRIDSLIGKEDQENLSMFSRIIEYFPELVLIVSKVFPFQVIPLQFLTVRSVSVAEKFKLLKRSHVSLDTSTRYLHAMLSSDILKVEPKTEGPIRSDQYLNSQIFTNLANQNRFGTFWKAVAVTFFAGKSRSSDAIFPYERAGPGGIASFLRNFDKLPFEDTTMKFVPNKDEIGWNVTAIPFMYSMMELNVDELCGNLDLELAKIIVSLRDEEAMTSLETRVLEKKGNYDNAVDYITSKVNINQRLKCDRSGFSFFAEAPRKQSALVDTSSWDHRVKAWVDKKLRCISDKTGIEPTKVCREILISLHCVINPGIYCKTATTLDAEKSIAPRKPVGLVEFAHPLSYVELADGFRVAYKMDWTKAPVFIQRFREKYLERIRRYWTELFMKDITKEYIRMLTANSQGQKVDLTYYDPMLEYADEDRKKLIEKAQFSRLAAFFLDQKTFEDKYWMYQNLKLDGKCTTRDQILRRKRVVEMVSNAEQCGYLIPLLFFNKMKKDYNGIAVGKQQGGIVDAYEQCSKTGCGSTINLYSDVVAMDASTTGELARITMQIIAEELIGTNGSQDVYMCWRTSSFIDEHGEKIIVPAIAQCLLTIAGYRLSKKFLLKDNIAKVEIPISSEVFPSGRFDTGAQHTVVLDIVSEMAWEAIQGRKLNVLLTKLAFGDDSFHALQFSHTIDYDVVNSYTNVLKAHMKLFGYDVETLTSEYYTDFLQQSAFCGGYTPKRPRASIFTDERGDTRYRDRKDQIDIMTNVTLASLQRTRYPEDGVSILFVIWECLRTVSFSRSLPGRFSDCVGSLGLIKYFQYPKEYPYFTPISSPSQSFQYGDIIIPMTGGLKMVGDNRYVYLYNYLLKIEDFELLENHDKDPWPIIADKLDETGIGKALVLYYYNASARLSKYRARILEVDINRMTQKIKRGYNEGRLQISYEADAKLKSIGVKVPSSLLYWKDPENRILDLFSKLPEDVKEIAMIKDDFADFMIYNQRKYPSTIVKKFRQLSFRVTGTFSPIVKMNPDISSYHLIPGYADTEVWKSDFNKVFRLLMTPFALQLDRGPLVHMANKYSKKFDLAAAVRIGAVANQHGEKAVNLLVNAMNLPEDLVSDFHKLITDPNNLAFVGVYSSTFQPDANFGISRSASVYEEVATGVPTRSFLFKALMENIGFDFIVNSISRWGYTKVQVVPTLYARKFFEKRFLQSSYAG